MPKLITRCYEFSGLSTVLLYSEQEMAEALQLTRPELRAAIARGEVRYHSHPSANVQGEYQFTAECYADNLLMQTCRRAGGHVWLWMRAGRAVCANCPAEKYIRD